MQRFLSFDKKNLLIFIAGLLIFLLSFPFFVPYRIISFYYLNRYGFEFEKVSNTFLGVDIKNLSLNDTFRVSDLSLKPGFLGLRIELPNIKGYIKYNKQLKVIFSNIKFDEKVRVKDLSGELNGYFVINLNQLGSKEVKLDGKLDLKTSSLGMVNINCDGKERFICTLDSPNIKGNFTGSLKNGFITGDFNGTVFGMEKKGERVNIAIGSVVK